MSQEQPPVTPAIEVLRASGIQYSDCFYASEEGVGTTDCAKELNIDEHAIVKAIVLEADGKPFIILMHGDMRASIKDLTRITGANSVTPCLPETIEKHTGYQLGAVSPFGTSATMPVYMEETILNLRKVYISSGNKGHLISMDPYDIAKILHPTPVKVGAVRTA